MFWRGERINQERIRKENQNTREKTILEVVIVRTRRMQTISASYVRTFYFLRIKN